MTPENMARIISRELDNGDNDQLDGITAIERVARQLAHEMGSDDKTIFLKLCNLEEIV